MSLKTRLLAPSWRRCEDARFSSFGLEIARLQYDILTPRVFIPAILRFAAAAYIMAAASFLPATQKTPFAVLKRSFRASFRLPPFAQVFLFCFSRLFARFRSLAACLEIMSPLFMNAFIASPEALMATILSPTILEARVASVSAKKALSTNFGVFGLQPRALNLQVLSPGLRFRRYAIAREDARAVLQRFSRRNICLETLTGRENFSLQKFVAICCLNAP